MNHHLTEGVELSGPIGIEVTLQHETGQLRLLRALENLGGIVRPVHETEHHDAPGAGLVGECRRPLRLFEEQTVYRRLGDEV